MLWLLFGGYMHPHQAQAFVLAAVEKRLHQNVARAGGMKITEHIRQRE